MENGKLRIENEMSSGMKFRYRSENEMKDSGVKFIGFIPQKWITGKAQYYFNVYAGGTPNTNDPTYWNGNIPWINSGEVQNCLIKNISRYITVKGLEESSTKLIPSNTTLLAMTGATCGKVGYLTFESAVNQSVMAFSNPKRLKSKYMYYYLMCQNRQIEYFKTGGAQGGINVDNGKKLYIIIPILEEQQKIANFLDEKTAQFDSVISKKEALIQKLEEAKKSLISEVVTGKVKVVKTNHGYELVERKKDEMKDSGVEWLGDVPKEWEIKKLKYLFRIKKNIAGKTGYDVLSVTQSGIRIKDITKNEGQLSMDYSKYQIVEMDDFIMNHMDLLTGFVDCSKFNGVTSPDYRVFRLINDSNCKEYYNYIFQSCYYNRVFYGLAQGVSGMGRWRLQTDKFLNFVLPLPPIEEQEQITYALEMRLEDINTLKNMLSINIEKLKEAKQSLISEAVTGKIEILD